MIDSFLYCWTDHLTNKLYIGIHKGNEDDGYISSGKLFLEEYKKRPNDFTRKIISHGTYEDVLKLETKILKTVNAKDDSLFYNQHNGDGRFVRKGPMSKELKEKIASKNRGRKRTEEQKQKMKDNWRPRKTTKGQKRTPEQIEKMKLAKIGRKQPAELIEKRRLAILGKPRSEETKRKISEGHKGKKIPLNVTMKRVKLSKEDIDSILIRINNKDKGYEIAKDYNVCGSLISRIKVGKIRKSYFEEKMKETDKE